MTRARLAGAVLLAASACGAPPAERAQTIPPTHLEREAPDPIFAVWPAPPAPTTTTTVAEHHEKPRAGRGGTRTVVAADVADPAFWRRLADCENRDGRARGGYFQFRGTEGAKGEYVPGSSYEAQRAVAVAWAAQIHPREGTRAGWPHCWAVAS